MLEMSGAANLRGRGNSCAALLLMIILVITTTRVFAQNRYYYFVCGYASDIWDTDVKISKVNLSIPAIIDSVNISLPGELAFKTPFIINIINAEFVIIANNGEAAKNSHFLDPIVANYCILDSNLNIILTSQIQNISILSRSSREINQELEIDYTQKRNNSFVPMRGRMALERSNHLGIRDSRENMNNDLEYPAVGSFGYLNRISETNDRYYWDLIDRGMYLLNIDINDTLLVDSLYIGDNMDYSYLFALSPNDSLLYFFHLNSNVLGGPITEQKVTIDPSYLKVFQAGSFMAVDSIPIQYPSLAYGYTYAEVGNCDRVGPFLVYYFFHGEDYRYFSPAMLFIFDTRTNEATWLRVGWR